MCGRTERDHEGESGRVHASSSGWQSRRQRAGHEIGQRPLCPDPIVIVEEGAQPVAIRHSLIG